MTKERVELHLKYRPKTFDDLIGNDALKESVISAIPRTRTFLFYGSRGCGKTTLARLIASEIKADEMDIYEIDAADKTGIDDARTIKDSAQYSPMAGKFKVYIMDECHRLSPQANDSLLKTLENPPDHCYFILCTTDFRKVPETIKSRAKCYQVNPLNEKEQNFFIKWICRSEGIKISDRVREAIIQCCEGVPREILVSLDITRDVRSDDDAVSLIRDHVYFEIKDLCQALLRKEQWAKVAPILKELYEKNEDFESIRYAVLGYMNSVLLSANPKVVDMAALAIEELKESCMWSRKAGLTYACYMIVK